tara:strand:+ start:1072 stop:2094 length:1023 start_codon:yes stop_codon:yes gene_type:complete
MQTEVLTMALVGCGNIARAHWRGIRNHAPRIKVTAVVDSNPDNAASMSERTGAAAYSSLSEALVRGSFDAVDLMLPHDLHEEAAIKAFRAGKHVLLEKPMAPDLAGCERIMKAAKEADTVFMIAEQAQYWPDIKRARELIEDGQIGQVVTARACFYDPLPLNSTKDDGVPWRFRLVHAGGGICIDGGAHWIRPLRMLLGEVSEVIATMGSHIPKMEGESWVQALIRFDSGVTGSFEALLSAGVMGPTEDFRITGTTGEVVIEHGRDGRLMLFNDAHPNGAPVMDAFQGKVDSYGFELNDFSLAVIESKTLEARPEYSLGELRTALAMYRSVKSRNWEKVW